jgi:hydroxyacylglutathione hydrolase
MIPLHLAGSQAQGCIENEPVAQWELGNHRNFVYLLIDWTTRSCLWIDPQKDLPPILEAIQQHGLQLAGVLLTHSHHDHVAGLPWLAHKFRGLPLYVHASDQDRLDRKVLREFKVIDLKPEPEIPLGNVRVQTLHTPGHSAGECCYFVEAQGRRYFFSGDTVFIRDCGRTDFPDSSNEQMFDSLQRIKTLPDDTILLPGHHYQPECASTLGREKQTSAPLKVRSVEELAALP